MADTTERWDELVDRLVEADRLTPALGRAQRVVCMSRVLAAACRKVGVAEEKLSVLGNRVATHRFRPTAQPSYDPRTIRAAFVGRITEQKNLHGVATALSLLRAQGYAVQLEICGRETSPGYLERATAPLRHSEWRHLGSLDNRRLPAVYNRADLYVGPSLFEGFQIPLIEALACGKPCVASDQPPASEILDARVGALVDPREPEAIAAGIAELKRRLDDPRRAALLRAACRSVALARFEHFEVSRREAALYLEVLEGHSRTYRPIATR